MWGLVFLWEENVNILQQSKIYGLSDWVKKTQHGRLDSGFKSVGGILSPAQLHDFITQKYICGSCLSGNNCEAEASSGFKIFMSILGKDDGKTARRNRSLHLRLIHLYLLAYIIIPIHWSVHSSGVRSFTTIATGNTLYPGARLLPQLEIISGWLIVDSPQLPGTGTSVHGGKGTRGTGMGEAKDWNKGCKWEVAAAALPPISYSKTQGSILTWS